MKRHVLTCSLGFVLAILVTAANIHDTRAAELLLGRAVENGFSPDYARGEESPDLESWRINDLLVK